MKLKTALLALALAAPCLMQATEIISHRGFWTPEGSAQNSRISLLKAMELPTFGSETDVWLTTDGVLMVNHDPHFDGVTIQDATSEQCKALTLKNGETMPTLADLLAILKKVKSPTKLIIEIKGHSTPERNRAAARATVEAVKAAKLTKKVEYISFSPVACEEVIALDPKAKVAYLSGGISPAELHKKGYTGIDYHMNELRRHPEWVKEAHDLGMTVNIWTVNSADLAEMLALNPDYLTTDQPVEALGAVKAAAKTSKK